MLNYCDVYKISVVRKGADRLLEFIQKERYADARKIKLAILTFERMCNMFCLEKEISISALSEEETDKLAVIGLVGSLLPIEKIAKFVEVSIDEKFAICNFRNLNILGDGVFLCNQDYQTRIMTVIANSAYLQSMYI